MCVVPLGIAGREAAALRWSIGLTQASIYIAVQTRQDLSGDERFHSLASG
jgi:hypothetical protein